MTLRATELLKAALELSKEDRAELGHALFEILAGQDDLTSPTDDLTDEEFGAELERRHQEYLRDPRVAIPWEEVRRIIFDR